MDYMWPTPGSSVHGILQARTLEWVAISLRLHTWFILRPLILHSLFFFFLTKKVHFRIFNLFLSNFKNHPSLCTWTHFLIVVKCTWYKLTILAILKVYDSLVFNTFMILCNHHSLVLEYLHPSKGNSIVIKQSLLIPSPCECKSLSRVWLSATPWTIQSMEFSRPEYWSG